MSQTQNMTAAAVAAGGSEADEARRWGIIMAAVLAAVHLPFVLLQLKQSMARPHYQFAMLVPVGFLVLFWPRLKETMALSPGNKLLAGLGFGMALFVQLVAVAFFSPFLGCAAAMITVLAVGYALGGWRGLFLMVPCVVFFLVMVPPPFELDTRIITSLQRFTGRKGSQVLDYFGIFHVLDGNVIEVPGRRLFVEEACSGIHGLLSTLVCALFYIAFVRRHWITSILLVAASIFWVLVFNTIRVAFISIALTQFDIDLTTGMPHEILGIVIFVLNLLMLLSTDQLLLFFSPDRWIDPEEVEVRESRGSMPLGLRLASLPLAVMFGVVAVGQAAVGVPLYMRRTITPEEILAQRQAVDADPYGFVGEELMPPEFEGWKRIKFEAPHRERNHIMGEYSKVWYYQHANGMQFVFSFDYTFPIEHDLTVCYRGTGWTIAARRIDPEIAGKDGPEGRPYCHATMQQSDDRTAFLCFSLMDRQGRILRMVSINPDKTLGELFRDNFRSLGERLDDSLMTLGLKKGIPRRNRLEELTQDNGQLQLFTMSYLPISEDRQAQLKRTFLGLRREFETRFALAAKKVK